MKPESRLSELIREAETDRMLVAQAQLETLVLVTADVALTSY